MNYRDNTAVGQCYPFFFRVYRLDLSVNELETQNALRSQALHDNESCLDLNCVELFDFEASLRVRAFQFTRRSALYGE
jgi:hypothetical protein